MCCADGGVFLLENGKSIYFRILLETKDLLCYQYGIILLFHLFFFINNLLLQIVQGTVKGYISQIILVKANDLK